MTTTTPAAVEARSTLRPRLLEAIRQAEFWHSRMPTEPGRKAIDRLRALAESPLDLAAFDAWLDGPWLPHKAGLESAGLRIAAMCYLDGEGHQAAFTVFRDVYLLCDESADDREPVRDDEP